MRERRIIYTKLAAEGSCDFLVLVAEKLLFHFWVVVIVCLQFFGLLKSLPLFLEIVVFLYLQDFRFVKSLLLLF